VRPCLPARSLSLPSFADGTHGSHGTHRTHGPRRSRPLIIALMRRGMLALNSAPLARIRIICQIFHSLFFPMLSAGIVGLPNVGKSTLFNAGHTHRRKAAGGQLSLFCTIDPECRGGHRARSAPGGAVEAEPPRRNSSRRRSSFVDIAGLGEGRERRRRAWATSFLEPHSRGERHRAGGALLRGRRHPSCRGARSIRCATSK